MRYHIESEFEIEKPISLEDVRRIEIDILRTFVEFCDKHNLKYFLAGGTLIGAMRHGGFVPWDDDMDVSMPRPDFEKFRQLTVDGKFGRYEIRSSRLTPDVYARPFDRIVDPRYMTRVKVDQKFISPWLDVHGLDGLPTDTVENRRHWDAAKWNKRFSRWTRTCFADEKSKLKGLLKRLIFFPVYLKGPLVYSDRLTALAKKYDFYESEYIAAYVAGYGRKERMPQFYFTDGDEKMWFEGILCSVPPHWDLELAHMYGSYNKLPPKKKRVFHIKKAWLLKTPLAKFFTAEEIAKMDEGFAVIGKEDVDSNDDRDDNGESENAMKESSENE